MSNMLRRRGFDFFFLRCVRLFLVFLKGSFLVMLKALVFFDF